MEIRFPCHGSLPPALLAALAAVLLASPGQPATTFGAAQPIATDVFSVECVVTADVDGDGDLDVVWSRAQGDELAWEEQRPDGSFLQHAIAIGHLLPIDVAPADLDGDGDLDLVVAFANDDTIVWYRNDGNQLFAERPVASGADNLRTAAVADVDRDGDLDVLSASMGDDTIAWHENDGNETFTERVVTATADGARDVAAADLDGDGDVDLVAASSLDDTVAWYENDGSQTFSRHVISAVADLVQSVAVADLDRDGDLDVVAASANDDRVRWFENDGNEAFAVRLVANGADFARTAIPVDLDGDGDLDVLAASSFDDTIAWHENDGAGSFAERVVTTAAESVDTVAAGDLDGDGDLDIVAGTSGDATVGWRANLTPRSTAMLPAARPVGAAGLGAISIDAGDLDRDGDADLVAASVEDDVVRWFRNDGAGGMAPIPAALAAGDSELVDGVSSAGLFDLDRDGDLDVLSTAYFGDDVAWHENPGGAAPGSFAHRLIDGSASRARDAIAGDLDGNGTLDVVAAVGGPNAVQWYAGDGQGGFTSAMVAATATGGAGAVDLGDLDGDGRLDIALAEPGATRVSWLQNLGGAVPAFARRTLTDAFAGADFVRLADVNGDGRLDLLATSVTNNRVAWFRNGGGQPPTMVLAALYSNVTGAATIEPGDLDADGDIDFVVAARNEDRLIWYEGRGLGTVPRSRPLPPQLDGVLGVVAADLDRDGALDLAVANADAGTAQWLPNRRALFWDDFERGSASVWSARTP